MMSALAPQASKRLGGILFSQLEDKKNNVVLTNHIILEPPKVFMVRFCLGEPLL